MIEVVLYLLKTQVFISLRVKFPKMVRSVGVVDKNLTAKLTIQWWLRAKK
jgi:hypothetical protein